jgi:hypothetical protein
MAETINSEQITCSCGESIGKIVQVGKEKWIDLGCVQLQYFRGRCGKCKSIIHFSSLDVQLYELVSEVLEMRKCQSSER